MATYYLNSGAGGTASGADWTNAFLTLTAALAAATTAGDVIKVHKTHTEEVGADTTWTLGANISIICVDKDASDALATMGTAAWIGNSTIEREITIAGARNALVYGLTFRIAGTSSRSIILGATDAAHFEWESCYFWNGNSGASARIATGISNTQQAAYNKLKNCTLRFGSTGGGLQLRGGTVEMEGGSVSSAGSAPTNLIASVTIGGGISFHGVDLSHLGSNAIVTGTSDQGFTITFTQCKMGTGFTNPLATQTPANKSSFKALLLDCASGDTHGIFGYYDAMGSCVTDSTIYFTAGAAAQSWKIVTSANCSYRTPFVSPWIALYNTATSAVTPYLEILRDGSTTAYTDAQVWGEFGAKVTTGSTLVTMQSDRQGIAAFIAGTTASDQAAGAGTGSWTGGTTPWSGKVDAGSSMTPAENGEIIGRVCVAATSATVYVDPQIRT